MAVNGQSFLVIDGYLLNYYFSSGSGNGKIIRDAAKIKKRRNKRTMAAGIKEMAPIIFATMKRQRIKIQWQK